MGADEVVVMNSTISECSCHVFLSIEFEFGGDCDPGGAPPPFQMGRKVYSNVFISIERAGCACRMNYFSRKK